MKKKIKIIDILCYISTGDYDKLPRKIMYSDLEWEITVSEEDYNNPKFNYLFDDYLVYSTATLNNEVEILDEEDEFEDIEEFVFGEVEDVAHYEMKDKINQLIKNQKKIIKKLNNQDNN